MAFELAPKPVNLHKDWRFAELLNAYAPKGGGFKRESFAHCVASSDLAILIFETNLLGNTRCALCSGFGHTMKKCPTASKLKHLS